jgi:hypothetical protein
MAYKVPPKNSQFKPGKSGNPNGRPKQIPALEKLLSDIPETDYEDIIAALVKKAKKGEVRAAEVLFDRAWGKAKESLEITDLQTVKSYKIVPASTRNRTGDSSE